MAPANPPITFPSGPSRRTFLALGFMIVLPIDTWPSPAMTVSPPFLTPRIVVPCQLSMPAPMIADAMWEAGQPRTSIASCPGMGHHRQRGANVTQNSCNFMAMMRAAHLLLLAGAACASPAFAKDNPDKPQPSLTIEPIVARGLLAPAEPLTITRTPRLSI